MTPKFRQDFSLIEDHLEQRLDLNTLVIDNPSATFFVRVAGESMREIGITDGDILVVDRSIENWENRIVVAVIDSEFTLSNALLNEMEQWC